MPLLVQRGHTVFALGRDWSRLDAFSRATVVTADLTDVRVMDRLPRRVDAVIHLAQARGVSPNETEIFTVNTDGTARILEYADRAGAESFVFSSSGSVYGGSEHLLRETDPLRPRDAYARSKVAAETLVRDHGGAFRTCVLRLFAPHKNA